MDISGEYKELFFEEAKLNVSQLDELFISILRKASSATVEDQKEFSQSNISMPSYFQRNVEYDGI